MRRLDIVLMVLLAFAGGWAAQELRLSMIPPPEYGETPKATDALYEVNAARKSKGLPPFIKDEKLTQGAMRAASYRADHLCKKHTKNDFLFLPEDSGAWGAGCAAWPDAQGWGTCFTYDRKATRTGAAWARGRDKLRYMELFVK